VVLIAISIEISRAFQAFVIRHFLEDKAAAEYVLGSIGLFDGESIDVFAYCFGSFAEWAFLHATKI
jgi:hypothetical protein